MERVHNFKDLRIWQKGIEIVKLVYGLTSSFPNEEKYGLVSQIRRCAVSVPSNIAEGFKRFHNREYKQFLWIALGSSADLETQLIISKELGYLKDNSFCTVLEKLDHLSRMTMTLMKKLK